MCVIGYDDERTQSFACATTLFFVQERLGNRKGGHSVSGWGRWNLTLDHMATLAVSIVPCAISARTTVGPRGRERRRAR